MGLGQGNSYTIGEPKNGIKKLQKLKKWSKRWNFAKISRPHGEAMCPVI